MAIADCYAGTNTIPVINAGGVYSVDAIHGLIRNVAKGGLPCSIFISTRKGYGSQTLKKVCISSSRYDIKETQVKPGLQECDSTGGFIRSLNKGDEKPKWVFYRCIRVSDKLYCVYNTIKCNPDKCSVSAGTDVSSSEKGMSAGMAVREQENEYAIVCYNRILAEYNNLKDAADIYPLRYPKPIIN